MEYQSKSISETAGIATAVLKRLSKGKREHATVLALYGDLGSGKTTFVQQLGKQLGVSVAMQSPTFVIMKSYKLDADRYKLLIHIDAYRLEKPEELERLGWQEVAENPHNLIVIEWAERIEKLLPQDAVRIRFKFVDEKTRTIEVVE